MVCLHWGTTLILCFLGVTVCGEMRPRISSKSRNLVKVKAGDDALLHCYVQFVSYEAVTWIRQSDLEILSAGQLRVTSDPRISISHDPRFGSYTLHLNGARVSDSGVYSCQINTVPIKELNVKLIVDEGRVGDVYPVNNQQTNSQEKDLGPVEPSSPSTTILEGPDIYFSAGGLVNLTCVVHSAIQPGRIFWYHQGNVISYYSSRYGVSITQIKKGNGDTRSSLILKHGSRDDEGTYTCRPEKPILQPAEARLFLINDVSSAASIAYSGSRKPEHHYLTLTLLVIILFVISPSHLPSTHYYHYIIK